MVNRLVSVGDDFTLPPAVKAADANLPERLGTTALNATYDPKKYPALGALSAGLVARVAHPAKLVFLGSSTTAGYLATAEQRYVHKLLKHIQAAYPSGTGTETNIFDITAAAATAPGVHGYNGGLSGATAATYCDDAKVAQIAAKNPIMVTHMVGSNDYAELVPVATYKANVLDRVNAIRAAVTGPLVQVLIHQQQRLNVFTPAGTWAEYGNALREIAEADRDNLAFIDLSEPYKAAGVYAGGTDPLDLIDPDQVHQTPEGHTFLADLLRVRLNINSATTATSGTPAAVSTRFTSDTFSGGDRADINGRITDTKLGGSFRAWSATPANGVAIVGGKLKPGTGSATAPIAAGILSTTPDMEVSAVVTNVSADFYIEARRAAIATAPAPNGYRVYITATQATLMVRVGGTTTSISSSYTYTAGDRVGIRCKGDQISLIINTVVKTTVTNSAVTGNGYFGTAATNGVTYELGDLAIEAV